MSFKMNSSHWQLMVCFMEQHDAFAKGKFAGPTGKAMHRKLWERLSAELNALGFGSRSVEKWQKTWADIKYNVKKKAANNKKEYARTGGGPDKETPLTDWGIKILGILGTTFFEGVDSSECGVPQESQDNQIVNDIQIDKFTENELFHVSTSQVQQMVQPQVLVLDGPREILSKYSGRSQVQQSESQDKLGNTLKKSSENRKIIQDANHDHEYLPKAKKKKTQADFENEVFQETLNELKLIRQDIHGVREAMVEISNTLKYFLPKMGPT
ncbi:unnamed protein product, partial [Phaedon cochleariae]